MSKKMYVEHKSFYVGGTYQGPESQRVMTGQMYVESLIPEQINHPLPLVLIHGSGQTAMNWMTTPDGRPGWAEWFAGRGWRLYILDRPACGRSTWQAGDEGPQEMVSASKIEKYFTAPKNHEAWPQARLHTQWPGKGHIGDPYFDQYYASLVPDLDKAKSERLMQAAGVGLLDLIGPAILIGHSQGGLHTWLVGDARPDLVKAIIAVEPSGPPYKDIMAEQTKRGPDRPWGLTIQPLAYDPEVAQESPLAFEQQPDAGSSGSLALWSQKGIPRRLVNLAKVPVIVITAQASYHALFDHFTVRYLLQGGVVAKHVRLEDHGVYGNGHMMMLEKNNLDIVALIEQLIISLTKK